MTADIKLPPLPHADAHILLGNDSEDVFIGDALTSYATTAILADRERTEGVMRMALEALANRRHEVSVLSGCWQQPCKAETALREHLKEST